MKPKKVSFKINDNKNCSPIPKNKFEDEEFKFGEGRDLIISSADSKRLESVLGKRKYLN